jgi:hypothetical protein
LSWRFSFANASPFSTRSPATVTRRGSKGKDGRPRARSVSRLPAREPEPDGGSTWETLDASFSRKNLRREPSDPARRHSLTRCVGLTERARRLRVFASRRRARTLDARHSDASRREVAHFTEIHPDFEQTTLGGLSSLLSTSPRGEKRET